MVTSRIGDSTNTIRLYGYLQQIELIYQKVDFLGKNLTCRATQAMICLSVKLLLGARTTYATGTSPAFLSGFLACKTSSIDPHEKVTDISSMLHLSFKTNNNRHIIDRCLAQMEIFPYFSKIQEGRG